MTECETPEGWPNKGAPYLKSNLTRNQLQVWIAQNLVPEAPIYQIPG